MNIRPSDVERFVDAPPPSLMAALVFGPDRGLVEERAGRLARAIVPDLSDPFRVADLAEGTLDSDPARLADEAAALSMIGGRRVVRVRGAGNGHTALFARLLDTKPSDALVVAEAGDLNKSASLRKLFTDSPDAAAIACYPDTPRDLADVVRNALKAEGLTIAPDAVDDAVSRLGSDRGVTRREIEKLALYAHGGKRVERADILAIMGDEAEARSEEMCDAAGEGNLRRLDLELERLWASDTSPIALVRAAMAHFQRLGLVLTEQDKGETFDSAVRRLRPPVHFSRLQSFRMQAQRWNAEKVLRALDLLLETEALCKTTAVPAQAVFGRAMFNVAAMARG